MNYVLLSFPFGFFTRKKHFMDTLILKGTKKYIQVCFRTNVQNQTRQGCGICNGVIDSDVKIGNMEISLKIFDISAKEILQEARV